LIWNLSDGTTVHLGGKVEGDTACARELRHGSELAKAGTPPYVMTLPPPGHEALRLDDAWHVHCWVNAAARVHGLLVNGPEVTAPAEWDDSLPDGEDAIH
jgi:hypothetical protein